MAVILAIDCNQRLTKNCEKVSSNCVAAPPRKCGGGYAGLRCSPGKERFASAQWLVILAFTPGKTVIFQGGICDCLAVRQDQMTSQRNEYPQQQTTHQAQRNHQGFLRLRLECLINARKF